MSTTMSEITTDERVVVIEELEDDAIVRHAICVWCYPVGDIGMSGPCIALCGTKYTPGLLPIMKGRRTPPDACPRCAEIVSRPSTCPVCGGGMSARG